MPNPPFPLTKQAIRRGPFLFVWGVLRSSLASSHTAAVAPTAETTRPPSGESSRCADRLLVIFSGSDSTMAKVGDKLATNIVRATQCEYTKGGGRKWRADSYDKCCGQMADDTACDARVL